MDWDLLLEDMCINNWVYKQAIGKNTAQGRHPTHSPLTVNHLTKLIEAYQKLGRVIEPRLEEDGSNFPWQSAVVNTVATVFERTGWNLGGKQHTCAPCAGYSRLRVLSMAA
ncbi:hypothetical protein VP01_2881g2 [Puccinia sorghi]|uniref:Uncharacterized protein n=1 Tax=Puccinia sorghi TaxID=27349 RepID=A0A0L6V1N7_9BASI|nr:hypothetical protein VP01_2881g2 [Puccinia sorghi]